MRLTENLLPRGPDQLAWASAAGAARFQALFELLPLPERRTCAGTRSFACV